MSDEFKSKERAFEFPMMPIFGVDLGERLGSMDARLARVESDVLELKRDIKAVDDRVDKCLVAINRLDERMTGLTGQMNSLDERLTGQIHALDERLTGRINSLSAMTIGLWVTVIGGFVLQFFLK